MPTAPPDVAVALPPRGRNAKTTAKSERERASWKVQRGCRMPIPRNFLLALCSCRRPPGLSQVSLRRLSPLIHVLPGHYGRVDHDTTRVA